jgi:uncharacterized protein (TIGR02265 family)
MADERVVFGPAIEGFFIRGLGRHLTPELKAKLLAEGLNLDLKVMPAVPAEVWARGVDLASRHLFPAQPPSQRHATMGRMGFDGFINTTMGRALLGMMRIIGPKRSLFRLTRSFRSANNFVEATIEELSPTDFRIALTDVSGMPTFWSETLRYAAELVGAVDPVIEPIGPVGPGFKYMLRWKTR